MVMSCFPLWWMRHLRKMAAKFVSVFLSKKEEVREELREKSV